MEGWSTRWITWPALLRGCTGWLLTRRRMTKVSGGWKLQRLNMCKASYLRILLSIWTFENEIITSIIFQGIINTCHESYDRTDTKLGPEAFRSLHSMNHRMRFCFCFIWKWHVANKQTKSAATGQYIIKHLRIWHDDQLSLTMPVSFLFFHDFQSVFIDFLNQLKQGRFNKMKGNIVMSFYHPVFKMSHPDITSFVLRPLSRTS